MRIFFAPPDTDDVRPTGASTENTDQFRYLPFVDGLRAISVVAVVAYHIGFPGVSGGFVGVDVFFVISGFLIINQIKDRLVAGRFSIISFYASRSLRILPPFLLVVLATDVVATIVLPTPAISWDFIPSAALAPVFVSNIVFLLTQGYFDISAIEKPLLHTWTLSVEEQFYVCAPIILIFVFRLGRGRFGILAAWFAIALLATSLVGMSIQQAASGRNSAFYLAHYRAWEFLAGGLIAPGVVSAMRLLPKAALDVIGWLGIGCILTAVYAFDAGTPYPSWSTVLPVAGAALVILCGAAEPTTTMARFLSLRWIVSIGLVSYGWYLWHWPILSFGRIARLDENSLLMDSLGAGALAFLLATISYHYLELPIRRWKKSTGNVQRPVRIVMGAAAACSVFAALGGASAYLSYIANITSVAARYGIDGQGILDNGCQHIGRGYPEKCFEGPLGILLGDSHASMLAGTLAKRFDALGFRLVSIEGPGCHPLVLAPRARRENIHHQCANRIAPLERLLARPDQIAFVIISANWGFSDNIAPSLSDLIAEFDPHTRILLVGQGPIFPRSSLECVVLGDRFLGNRDRCVVPRRDAEVPPLTDALKTFPIKYRNVRYIDPLEAFCDQSVCRPFEREQVFFSDSHHVEPNGADRLYEMFRADFLWLAGGA